MKNAYKFFLILVVVATLFVFIFAWVKRNKKESPPMPSNSSNSQTPNSSNCKVSQIPVEKIINGIPFYGMYTSGFKFGFNFYEEKPKIPFGLLASLGEILGYYKDKHFNPNDPDNLKGLYADIQKNSSEGDLSEKRVGEYMKQLGYETAHLITFGSNESIDLMKAMINCHDSPIIAYQKITPSSEVRGYRRIIGYSEEKKEVLVNDSFFGSNYAISYDDFSSMFDGGDRSLFTFWPSAKLAGTLEGPDRDKGYEPQSKLANLAASLFHDNIDGVAQSNLDPETNIKTQEKFVQDRRFGEALPPLYRVNFYCLLASGYNRQKNPEAAINLVTNKILPINKELDKVYPGFAPYLVSKKYNYQENDSLWPYEILMEAYILKGEKSKAENVLAERMKLAEKNNDLPMHPGLIYMQKLLK
jgi:hypothetical protein